MIKWWGCIGLGLFLLVFAVVYAKVLVALPLLIIGGRQLWLNRRNTYVRVIRGESNTVYGPYKNLEEAERDTTNLECDEMGAFKASNYKGAVRVHPAPIKKWWS